jgi:L-ascorbate metabolism protein UlaG (beta-lactamase superfamily)
MQVEWYGQSAFALRTPEATVFLDPFGDVSPFTDRGMRFDYPPIAGVVADLVLVTHEHFDHNAPEVIGGDPQIVRSTAGRFDTPIGTVVAVASEHDPFAGTERGPNTIFVFELDGLRIAHLGDFGQAGLRDEQAKAIGRVDLALVPVGGGPTIGAPVAAAITRRLDVRWVIPMHYRTERIDFLEPADAFLEAVGVVHRAGATSTDTAALPRSPGAIAVVLDAP